MRQIQARKHKKEHYDNMFRFYWSIIVTYSPMDEKRKTSRHTPYVQNLQNQDTVQDF